MQSIRSSNLLSTVKPKAHPTIEFSKARDWVKYSDDGELNCSIPLLVQSKHSHSSYLQCQNPPHFKQI